MSIIICKKYSEFNDRNEGGLLEPLFEKKIDGNFKSININDFPNNGKVYLPNDISSVESNRLYFFDKINLKLNKNYEEQLKAYQQNSSLRNPSQNIIHKNAVLQLLPYECMRVHQNSFQLKYQELIDWNGIYDNEVFFLQENNFVYGPFKRNNLILSPFNFKSIEDEFEEIDEFYEFLDLYSDYDGEYIFKIDRDEVLNFLIYDSEQKIYLTDFKSIVKNKIGKSILFCKDSEILHWGKDKLKNKNPEFKKIIDLVDTDFLSKNISLDIDKWKRFKELLITNIEQEEVDLVKNILADKGFLQGENDPKLTKELEELRIEIRQKNEEIIDLKDRIENINQQVSQNNDSENFNFDTFPSVKEAIKFPEKLETLLKESNSVDFYKGQKKTMEEQHKELLDKVDIQQQRNQELKLETDKIIQKFNEAKKDLTADLAKTKIYTDLLNGIEGMSNSLDKSKNIKAIEPPTIIEYLPFKSAKEYIEELQSRLKNQGRNLSFNDVANLIITVNQSFLTILAGAPGVGKTSLVDKFSKSIGLSDKFGYLEVACAKGWNSSKDLIGFYNPISQRYQPSKTKLKDALENSEKYKNSPYIVLLDEANLSPLEHYWSDFVKLADFDYERKIKISDSETIEFGNGFRFLATINHDHTTEILSNRLLDRASIIQIEKPTSFEETSSNNIINVYNEIFDFKSANELFKETSKWKSEERTLNNKFEEFIKKIETSGLVISPRKIKSIKNYLRVSTGLLEGNDYTALDYAIAQQILPIINFRGEKNLELLKEIKGFLDLVNMSKSSKLVSAIIERGKEFKHFRYIYY